MRADELAEHTSTQEQLVKEWEKIAQAGVTAHIFASIKHGVHQLTISSVRVYFTSLPRFLHNVPDYRNVDCEFMLPHVYVKLAKVCAVL